MKAAGFLATGDTAVAMIMEWNMRHFFLSTATLLSMLGASSAAWAQQQPGPSYGPHMWGWMFFGPLIMSVVIGAVVAVVVILVRGGGGPPPGRTPLDILKERFARGEIDKEEFEERRRVLGE
ncbi:MAG: SHOCT domain-containing protein [Rhodospirillales bacterium]|nr:SHOCT domain-containing protein [Rhodospirillales bacterium]MDH3969758.1 SHOCT domain-containing protein [Rhodospirillales bacterium]